MGASKEAQIPILTYICQRYWQHLCELKVALNTIEQTNKQTGITALQRPECSLFQLYPLLRQKLYKHNSYR